MKKKKGINQYKYKRIYIFKIRKEILNYVTIKAFQIQNFQIFFF